MGVAGHHYHFGGWLLKCANIVAAEGFHIVGLSLVPLPISAALGTDDASLPNRLQAPYYPVGVIAGVYDSDFNEDYQPGRDDGLVVLGTEKARG